MEYITHHRFKGIGLCGKRLNLPYATKVTLEGDILKTKDGEPICFVTSENSKRHFSRNDDGCGIERGKLTYAIAFGNRVCFENGRRQKFSDSEILMLERHYSEWLRKDVSVILFNDSFFSADVGELEQLAERLKIHI
ncbi:MAG: hypothetical protein LUH56_03005 [Oscillospiraceae bacterium]|nr:hypothetical protein [Oscillospiraceae bacterium]